MPASSRTVGTRSTACTYCVPHLAARRDARRPVDDQRIGDAALVRLALPPAERRVAGDRPAPRVVVVQPRAADVVDAVERFSNRPRQRVPCPAVVAASRSGPPSDDAPLSDSTITSVLSSSPISSSRSMHPTDLRVGVRQEAGERLHVPRVDTSLVVVEVVPRRAPTRDGATARCAREAVRSPSDAASTSSRHTSQPRSNRPR